MTLIVLRPTLAPSPVPSDELVGDVVQVIANDVRLRAHPQHIVADPLDQRGLPAGRHGTKRVPMARDQTSGRTTPPPGQPAWADQHASKGCWSAPRRRNRDATIVTFLDRRGSEAHRQWADLFTPELFALYVGRERKAGVPEG